jgi:DNA-directed RNA polymerase III subunit RPC1
MPHTHTHTYHILTRTRTHTHTHTQDFLTAFYLLTQQDVFFDKSEFSQLVCGMNDASEHIDLPNPAILKPISLWTGKQIFTVLLRPKNILDSKEIPLLNTEVPLSATATKDGLFTGDGSDYVVIRNSELLSGYLCKKTMGGSKRGVIFNLIRDYGAEFAARAMNRVAKFSARYIGNRGFSIGIDDVTPSHNLAIKKKELMDTRYEACEDQIQQFERGELACLPGMCVCVCVCVYYVHLAMTIEMHLCAYEQYTQGATWLRLWKANC